jgi:hypothetical protein
VTTITPSSFLVTLPPVMLPVETQDALITPPTPGNLVPNNDPAVVITATARCEVSVLPGGPFTDQFTVTLSHAPTATVFMTISALFGGGTPYAQISIDGGASWHDTVVLVFAAGQTGPKTVMVRLRPGVTALPAGSIVETLSSSLVSTDATFNRMPVSNVYVNGLMAECTPVVPVVPTNTGATTPLLSATGVEVSPLTVLLALLAILAGLGALVASAASRRRRHVTA